MAEVWLARRADGAFKREIALKLPMRNRPQAGLEAEALSKISPVLLARSSPD
jgi:hypothetical protein